MAGALEEVNSGRRNQCRQVHHSLHSKHSTTLFVGARMNIVSEYWECTSASQDCIGTRHSQPIPGPLLLETHLVHHCLYDAGLSLSSVPGATAKLSAQPRNPS